MSTEPDEYKFPALSPEVFEATAKEIKAIEKAAAPQAPNVVESTTDQE